MRGFFIAIRHRQFLLRYEKQQKVKLILKLPGKLQKPQK